MRKTSQDGGDSTSITSGFENELKKASVGIMKTKRNSLKRKVQNFSHESDDTVIEPLLQIDKNETANRSAKYLLSKSKTDSLGERDTNILYSDNNVEKSCVSKYSGITGAITTTTNISKTLHNHMNTNIFGSHDVSKVVTTAKSPILVEICGSRPAVRSGQTSSIFTTAKIHADNITKHMEPIQVTPVPILSTVEGNVVKAGISPDYAQNKNIIPSTSSSILKPITSQDKGNISNTQQYDSSHLTRTEDGKSDLYRTNTEHMVKKLTNVLDNRSSISITEPESILLHKPLDTKKENVKASSVAITMESEKVSKITPQLKPSISKTSDIKIKSIHEQRDEGFKDNLKSIQKTSDIKNNEIDGRITLQNQNAFNLKSPVLKDDVRKKEDKNISSTSGGSKQLQRQKNAICESDKLDDVLNNDSTRSKNIIGTQSSSITSDAIMSTSKSKDNLTKSEVSHKSDAATEKKMLGNSTQVCKPVTDNFTPTTTNEIQLNPVEPFQSITAIKTDSKETKTSSSLSVTSKPTDKKSLVTATTTKTITSKPIDSSQLKSSTTSLRSDLAVGKKIVTTPSEITKPVKEKSALNAVTTKGVSPKVIDTVLSKPSTSLVQSDSMLREITAKPTEICKPITENLSTITTGHSQESTTAVTTTQSTDPTKLDSIKENKTVGVSNQTSKFSIDNSSHITGKGDTQKSNTATIKSVNINQSASVKDSKTFASSVSTSKSIKDKTIKEGLTSKPSGTNGDKSTITTDTKVSIKTVQNSKNLPESKDISVVGASSCASTDLKNTMTSVSHKTDKVQNKTLSDEKSKIPITVVPTSTIPIRKTEVKSQSSNVLPSSAKYSVSSKVEPSNISGVKSTTVTSTATTTNTTTTTLAKSTNQKISSKSNVLDKHGKI